MITSKWIRERGIPLDVQQQVDAHNLFHSDGGHRSILKSRNKREWN